MGAEKKLILSRVVIVALTVLSAFQVGGSLPCRAHETQLGVSSQANLLAPNQNAPSLISSLLEARIENPGATEQGPPYDPVEKRSDEPGTRTVRVGIYQNPPKVFIDKQGHPSGIFIDLLVEIARKEKWNLVYVPGDWTECLKALEEHRIDLMPDVAYSRERDKKYDFPKTPVVDSWSQVYTNSKTSVLTLSDLNGRRVAVLKGGIQEEIFKQMMNGYGFKVTIIPAETYEEAFSLAGHGYADAVIANHLLGDYLFQTYGLTKTPIVFNPTSLYFATAKGRNPELLTAIDRDLNAWRSEPGSYYYRTLSRWTEKPPAQVVPRYIIWIIAITGGFLLLSAGTIQLLRTQVRAKTEYLVKANESFRKSEEKYRSLVENLNDVIFNLDAHGNITYMNPVAETIFGYRAEEIRGRSFSEFIHADDLPGVMKSRGETLGGVLEPYEFRMLDKNGSVHFVRTSSRPIERDGQHVGITGILTDITEKKKMELQLLQTEKLSAVGTMISGVAHELNNPLTAIIGNAQLIARRDVPEDIKGKLDVILKESIRSSKIVGGLLAFAREHKPERSMVNVNDIVMECMKLKEYDLRVNNIAVKLSLAGDLPETSADPYQVQQVFINLINNARDALADQNGGELAVRTYKKDDTVLTEFDDSGPGIPDEFVTKIFEPFFTTKETAKGTGLGLSMAYGIIEEHGGRISLESKPGKGAKFVVTLPITESVPPAAEKVKVAVNPLPGAKTLLVVEDEESLRNFLFDALTEAGFTVETASTGKGAIDLVGKRKFDAVISDVKMPGIGGKEIYRYIQKHHPEIAEKIIFITGDVLNKDTQSFLRITTNKFIEKPFEIDALVAMLHNILSA